jgi:long-chain acyl-CoA synthetase
VHVGKVLSETAKRTPQKTAVIFKDEEITFSQLELMATRLANKLRTCKVDRGDRVAIVLPNSSQWVVAYFSIMKLGAVAVPLDFRLKGEELFPILTDARVKVAITSELYSSVAVFSEVETINGVIVTGERVEDGLGSYEEVIGDESLSSPIIVDTREDEEALYLYTSGTTGKPKGVVLSFANLDMFPEGMGTILKTSEDDVLGCLLPMSHITGPILCNELVVRGSTLFIFDQLRPDKILSGIERQRVTYFHSVPPIFEALLHVPHKERFDLSSLRFIAMMGTSVPLPLLTIFKKTFPSVAVIQGYGLTETSPFITLLPLEYEQQKIGSIGVAVPRAEVKLVNEQGEEVPVNDVGELIVKGPMLMKGYHNNPDATRERIRDGWLYTGDLCRKDEDGFYYHLGRKDDMIIVGGLNVYPAEVEQVLQAHPLLREVGVVGMPDKDRGEIIKAAVVVKPGSEITKKEIIAYCKQRLATFKVPKIVELWDELPKSSTGKIARRLLLTPHHNL